MSEEGWDLAIRRSDWVIVALIGVVFGGVIAAAISVVIDQPMGEGALFGALAGLSIAFWAALLTILNTHLILPYLSVQWWPLVAAFFSFSAGAIGFAAASLMAQGVGIGALLGSKEHITILSLLVGVMTYLLGLLIYLFVQMRNRREAAHKALAEARIVSLQQQLNPHFLFNALNSVAALIDLDPKRAEEAVIKIASFLRQTMAERAMITLDEELANVQHYVDIEQIRFGEAIRLEIVDEGGDRRMMVPKFSVQLLVENAIKHGRSLDSQKLEIIITLLKDRIRVANSGPKVVDPTFGIGLANLDERLKHLCQGRVLWVDDAMMTFEIRLGHEAFVGR
ncbi:MAG: histidine kinase [Campylobacterales bacterium]